MVVRLFYERRIGTLAAVAKEAETMDADAGIRMSGNYKGQRCYAFVSRFGPRYIVMVYKRNGGRLGRVRNRLASEEFGGAGELKKFLREIAPGKVEAFAY